MNEIRPLMLGRNIWIRQNSIVFIYLTAIVIANLSVAIFGPSSVIINAFLFIGLDLTSRDKLHEAWHNNGLIWKMALLIGTGSILSWILNRDAGRIAIASFIAFAIASIVDTFIYHILYRRDYLIRVNGSNIFGALADSIIFPTIAFGIFMPLIIVGQFLAKVLGGFMWSFILKSININYKS